MLYASVLSPDWKLSSLRLAVSCCAILLQFTMAFETFLRFTRTLLEKTFDFVLLAGGMYCVYRRDMTLGQVSLGFPFACSAALWTSCWSMGCLTLLVMLGRQYLAFRHYLGIYHSGFAELSSFYSMAT